MILDQNQMMREEIVNILKKNFYVNLVTLKRAFPSKSNSSKIPCAHDYHDCT